MPQQNPGGSNMGADKKVSDGGQQRPGNQGQDATKKQDGDRSSGQRTTDQQKPGLHSDAVDGHSGRTGPDSGNARGNDLSSGRKGDATAAEDLSDSEEGSDRKDGRGNRASVGADAQARKTSSAPAPKSADNTKASR
jgi:hypothetical protein